MINEKKYFTEQRLEFLKIKPAWQSLERWGEYCVVPLDIPTYNCPKLVNWFFKYAKPATKLKVDVASDNTGFSNFDSVEVIPEGPLHQGGIWSVNLRQDFLEMFPDIYQRLLHDFPFKSIQMIRLWSSTGNVIYHRDQTKFLDFPGSFRLTLHDSNPISTLSYIETLPDATMDYAKKFRIPRLADTKSFVFNNLRTKHGSVFLPGSRKILMILDQYELDIDRYEDLITRSISKYHKECLISSKQKNEYIL